MTEKEMFIKAWEREFQTTMKVLNAYPKDKLDLKPHERSRSAKELAWNFPAEERVFIEGVLTGTFDFGHGAKPPATLQDIIAEYQKTHTEMVDRVNKLSDQDMHTALKFFVGPNKMADVRRGDLLANYLMDKVHHRGQFSVYLRMAGGKVPSIYGPTADEPWR